MHIFETYIWIRALNYPGTLGDHIEARDGRIGSDRASGSAWPSAVWLLTRRWAAIGINAGHSTHYWSRTTRCKLSKLRKKTVNNGSGLDFWGSNRTDTALAAQSVFQLCSTKHWYNFCPPFWFDNKDNKRDEILIIFKMSKYKCLKDNLHKNRKNILKLFYNINL